MAARYLIIALVLAVPGFAQAADKALANKTLVCIESGFDDVGNDKTLGEVTTRFDAKGIPSTIRVKRPKTAKFPALDETLIASKGKLSAVIEENMVEEVDELTGEKIYPFGIKNFTVVRGNQGDVGILVAVDDHMYAGYMGSTIRYQKGKLKSEAIDDPSTGDATVGCEVKK